MNIQQIREEIKKIPTTKFGISVPQLKKFAGKIAKENYREFLDNNKFETFELKMLHAFVLGYARDDIEILLKYFDCFVPQVDDWAINDALCQTFKQARQHQQIVWDYLEHYHKSKKEFEIRIVAVMLLSHYLNDKYINQVIKVLDTLYAEKYYAQMGIAWAIATIMAKYPELCLKYLQSESCHLNRATYNKSLQKIRESLRISKEIKENVKKLKK